MTEIVVGVRDLKSHLSEYLRRVQQGQIVIITDHGHPIGHLLPVSQNLEDRLKLLQDIGMVVWNGKKLKSITPVAVNRSNRQVSDILVEMRG